MLMVASEHVGREGGRGPGFIIPLLLLLLIGFLVSRAIRRRRGGPSWHHHGSPIQTLEDRFARGDIDRAEFEHRKAVLVGADVVPPAPATAAPPAPPATAQPPADAQPSTADGDADDDGGAEAT